MKKISLLFFVIAISLVLGACSTTKSNSSASKSGQVIYKAGKTTSKSSNKAVDSEKKSATTVANVEQKNVDTKQNQQNTATKDIKNPSQKCDSKLADKDCKKNSGNIIKELSQKKNTLNAPYNDGDLEFSLDIVETSGKPYLELKSLDDSKISKVEVVNDEGMSKSLEGGKVPLDTLFEKMGYVKEKDVENIIAKTLAARTFFKDEEVTSQNNQVKAEEKKEVNPELTEYRKRWMMTSGQSEDSDYKIFATGCYRGAADDLPSALSAAKQNCKSLMGAKALSVVPDAVSYYLSLNQSSIKWDEKLESKINSNVLNAVNCSSIEDYFEDGAGNLWVLMSLPAEQIYSQVRLAFAIEQLKESVDIQSAKEADNERRKALSYYSGYTI